MAFFRPAEIEPPRNSPDGVRDYVSWSPRNEITRFLWTVWSWGCLTGLFCRDSEESCDSRVSEIELPSKFVLSNAYEVTDAAKTEKFVFEKDVRWDCSAVIAVVMTDES